MYVAKKPTGGAAIAPAAIAEREEEKEGGGKLDEEEERDVKEVDELPEDSGSPPFCNDVADEEGLRLPAERVTCELTLCSLLLVEVAEEGNEETDPCRLVDPVSVGGGCTRASAVTEVGLVNKDEDEADESRRKMLEEEGEEANDGFKGDLPRRREAISLVIRFSAE